MPVLVDSDTPRRRRRWFVVAVTAAWVLAIDFGTSFTVAASRIDGRSAEVIEVDGERRVPSVVMITDDGGIVVGRAAEEMAAALPTRVLRSPKARLGDPAPIILGGRPYLASSLAAEVLAKVYEEALRYHDSAPRSTRLTFPASWSGQRRQQLLRAAELAGLPETALVPEPIAAAIAYSDAVDVAPGRHVLVYDLGGGTLDCAVLRSAADGFELAGRPTGDRQLGGELFDELLANAIGERLPSDIWLQLQLGDEPPWRQSWVALRREARRAKELLSTQPTADILIGLPNGIREVRVTRADLDSVIGPHLVDSVQLLQRTVVDADVTVDDLEAIYLVGGASRMPLVEVLIREAFPTTHISRRGDPKSVVALGATHPSAVNEAALLTLGDQITDPNPRRQPAPVPAPAPAPTPVPEPESISTGVHSTVADTAPRDGPVHAPTVSGRTRRWWPWAMLAAVILAATAVALVRFVGDADGGVAPDVSGTIVFSSARNGDQELYTMRPDGSDVRQLTSDIGAVDHFPAWSPDGTRIAWTSGNDVMVMDRDGSGVINLTAEIDDVSEKPAWTPDGAAIVFVRTVDQQMQLWTMSSSGDAKRLLVASAPGGMNAYDAAIDADGALYFSSRIDAARVDLFVTDLAGATPQAIGPLDGPGVINEAVDVSSAAGRLAVSRTTSEAYEVVVAALDGTNSVIVSAVTDPAPGSTAGSSTPDSVTDGSVASTAPLLTQYEAAWSPKGSTLVLVVGVGSDSELWRITPGGTGPVRLTDDNSMDVEPAWTAATG